MRKANLISGVLLLSFSVLLLFWLIPWQVEETFDGQVSPRLLPQICAIGIGVLSVFLIVTNLSIPASGDRPSPISWVEARAMLVIGGLLGAAVLLFGFVGPIIACTIMIVGVLFAMGERRVAPYILIPLVLLGGSYILFYEVLGTAII